MSEVSAVFVYLFVESPMRRTQEIEAGDATARSVLPGMPPGPPLTGSRT
jgi:hypothetical protein